MDSMIAYVERLMPLAKFGYWSLGIVFFVFAILIEIKIINGTLE